MIYADIYSPPITIGLYGNTIPPPQIVGGYFGLNLIKDNKLQFVNKLNSIAQKLGIAANWLMVVMWKESRLQPNITNSIGAGGLIQFLPSTAIGLGTTVAKLIKMSATEQLDYVYKFFAPYKKFIKDYPSLYLAAFLPDAFNHDNNWAFRTKKSGPAIVAEQNPGIDLNKDGKIVKPEFYEYVYKQIPKNLLPLVNPNYKNSTELDNAGNLLPGVEITAKTTK